MIASPALPRVRVGGAVLALLGLLASLLVASPAGSADAADPPDAPDAPGDRPNIILITTDDQTTADMRWMPLTRAAIGDAGVDFERGISNHPLCCPARAEMLTGQYAQNNGVRNNRGRWGGYPALRSKDNTVATWLRDSGYRTGFVGKFLNEYAVAHGRPGGWDYWNPLATNVYSPWSSRTYAELAEDGGFLETGEPAWEPPAHDPENPQPPIHQSDELTEETLALMDAWTAEDSPFFIWASYVAPHTTCDDEAVPGCWGPPVPAARHAELYPDAVLPSRAKPSFNERNVSDKPPGLRSAAPRSVGSMQTSFLQRIRSLAAVDEGVARIVDALADAGELDDTYLVFTSDNGYLLGEHRISGKIYAYRESLSVPFLVRGPGIPAGQVRRQIVSTVDLAPTIAAMAGATPGRVVDGVDFLPQATADAPLRRTSLVQAGPRYAKSKYPWLFRGVHTGRYTLTWWRTNGFVELYDHAVDPHELTNVAKQRRYLRVRWKLLRWTRMLGRCAGATCRVDLGREPTPLPRRPARAGF